MEEEEEEIISTTRRGRKRSSSEAAVNKKGKSNKKKQGAEASYTKKPKGRPAKKPENNVDGAENDEELSCEYCGKTFSSALGLKYHSGETYLVYMYQIAYISDLLEPDMLTPLYIFFNLIIISEKFVCRPNLRPEADLSRKKASNRVKKEESSDDEEDEDEDDVSASSEEEPEDDDNALPSTKPKRKRSPLVKSKGKDGSGEDLVCQYCNKKMSTLSGLNYHIGMYFLWR